MGKQTMSVKEASEYIGVSKDLIYKLAREGKIPCARLGRRLLFRAQVIDQWLAMKEQELVGEYLDDN